MFQKRRILVVDDSIDNLLLLETALGIEGYEVESAINGKVAFDKIRDSPPDLILLDVMMPVMSGYELTKRIRQDPTLSEIPIILVTAYGEIMKAPGEMLGANDFICKPIDLDELLRKVRTFCPLERSESLLTEE
jgi:two-component system, sensor histidine kinase and response regulator